MSAKRITLIVGESVRNISSEELSSLNASGCIERNSEDQIRWVEKRTVRFLMPEVKLRGQSCKMGTYLATAIKNKEFWALLMRLQITVRRPQTATKMRNWHFNGIRAIPSACNSFQP